MHPTLEPYEKLVQERYLNKNERDNLVLYNYTDQCTFDRHWNKYTLAARGIIFDKETGECVARSMRKFFNLSEHESTQLKNLPNEPYHVFEKLDGSLGILRDYNGQLNISTRGSFTSQQAITATEILRTKYPKFKPPTGVTLHFEIIYPENRMCAGGRLVCDYGDMRDLVLLAGVYIDQTQGEMPYDELVKLSHNAGFPICKKYDYTIQEMIVMQKTLPVTQEGFVVHYLKSNLRVKIKGEEYCKRQKILNGMTPLNIWAVLDQGVMPDTYKIELPEEILPEALTIEASLKRKYDTVKQEVLADVAQIPYPFSQENRKNIALWLNSASLKHKSIMFPYLLEKKGAVETYIKEVIRPANNVL